MNVEPGLDESLFPSANDEAMLAISEPFAFAFGKL